MNIKIKDLPASERPRERLLSQGVESLSNEDLLAIILKTGTKDTSAKGLATTILSTIDNITNLKKQNYNQLTKIKGIGPSKASIILASIELGHRINNEYATINSQKINTPQTIFKHYEYLLKDKKQECFYVVYLDNQKIVIEEKLLFMGTINKSLIHPQNIFKEAYLLDASSIICVHNHPSGNVIPSGEDIKVTKQLIEIGNLFGIKLIDHIIIGKNKYYSFFESGDM